MLYISDFIVDHFEDGNGHKLDYSRSTGDGFGDGVNIGTGDGEGYGYGYNGGYSGDGRTMNLDKRYPTPLIFYYG